MCQQFTVKWQFPDDPDEDLTLHTEHAPPQRHDKVCVDGKRYVVEGVEWSIFKRPDAPCGDCIDVFAVVTLYTDGD